MFKYLLPVIVIAIALTAIIVIQRNISHNYEYQCGKCGSKFSLPFWKSFFSMHSLASKYVRCPECGESTWATLIKKDS